MPLEKVAETMPEGDLRDLSDPLEIADASQDARMSHRGGTHHAPLLKRRDSASQAGSLVRAGLVARGGIVPLRRTFEHSQTMFQQPYARFQILQLSPGGEAKITQRALE